MAKSIVTKALEPMERAASKRGQRKLDLRKDYAERERVVLPYDNGYAYTILLGTSLCTTQSLAQALQEVRRVLRPGGHAVGAVWTRSGRDFNRAKGLFYFSAKEVNAALNKGYKLLDMKPIVRREPDKQLVAFHVERTA